MRRRAGLIGLSILLLNAALAAAREKAPRDEERAAVRAVDLAFAAAAVERDAERFRSLLAEDGVFLGERIDRGSDAFAATWSPLFEGDTKERMWIEWEPLEVGVAAAGDLAYSIGRVKVSFSYEASDEVVERPGHYLSVWTRDEEGAWKLAANGHLVAHPEGDYGFGRERRRGLAEVWPPLAELDTEMKIDFEIERRRVAESQDLAFTFGEYTLETRRGDESKSGRGGYLRLWKKDAEDFWIIAAESFSLPR